VRAFISIDVPEQIKRGIAAHTVQMKSRCIHTIATENLHISLLFMGDINNIQLKAAEDTLCAIRVQSFYISFGEVKFFDEENPRIAYISINEGNLQVKSIFDSLSTCLKGIICIDSREFTPHLTIARIKGNCGEEIKALKAASITEGRFKCDSIKIIESITGRGTPVYKEIFSKRL
jgi:2'-5' RNA ligase